ncbi:MAG: rod shape-determining protein MreC [Treponema sp.]|jgi:rod shape-determining protein MreC|nr:rod shape-determining protein MreC [Treponema sp.]
MGIDDGKKQKSRFSADASVFLILSLVSFLSLYFSNSSFVVDFKDMGLSFFLGSRNVIYEITSFVSRTVLSIGELATLRKEYAELTDRVTRYEQLERTAAEIRQENRRLREQLNFSQSLGYKHIPAELIGRDPDNLFSTFVINKGTRAGVAVNMPVIAYQNGVQGLVGKVVQTAQFESLVMPLYDVSSFVSSRLSELRYEGITEGQGNPETPFLMRFINKRARDEIGQGDMIITSGMGGVFPVGINIGRVSRILFHEYESSMEVELEGAIDFSRLEYVFVLDASAPEETESDATADAPTTDVPEKNPASGGIE